MRNIFFYLDKFIYFGRILVLVKKYVDLRSVMEGYVIRERVLEYW